MTRLLPQRAHTRALGWAVGASVVAHAIAMVAIALPPRVATTPPTPLRLVAAAPMPDSPRTVDPVAPRVIAPTAVRHAAAAPKPAAPSMTTQVPALPVPELAPTLSLGPSVGSPIRPAVPVDAPTVTPSSAGPVEPVPPSAQPSSAQAPAPAQLDRGPGVAVGYDSNPKPAYPRAAQRRGDAGKVLLRVLVAADGRPLKVTVEQSSGHTLLDQSALESVATRWRFAPGRRDGAAIESEALVPIVFSLSASD